MFLSHMEWCCHGEGNVAMGGDDVAMGGGIAVPWRGQCCHGGDDVAMGGGIAVPWRGLCCHEMCGIVMRYALPP